MNDKQLIQLISEKKYEVALQILFNRIEIDPNDVVNYINAGTILADANQITEAEKFFQKALTIDDAHGGAYYGLANIYYNKGRFQEAIKLYQKAIENHLDDADTFFMLGMSFVSINALNESLPYLMRAKELKPDDEDILFQNGLVYCQLDLYEAGLSLFNQVLAINPKHTDAKYNQTLALYMLNEDVDQAIASFKEILNIQPGHLLAGHALNNFKRMKEE